MNRVAQRVRLIVAAVVLTAAVTGAGYLAQVSSASPPSAYPFDDISSKPSHNGPPGNKEPEKKAAPIPADVSIWEDVPEGKRDNQRRLADRPGNFEMLNRIAEFFEQAYAVEPKWKDAAYPLHNNGGRFATQEALLKATQELEAKYRADGGKRSNGLRQFNVVIHKIAFHSLKENELSLTNPAELGLDMVEVDRFSAVRKDHKEQCWLALVRASLESLGSGRVDYNKRDADFILCYVKKPEGWKLVWFDK